MTALNVASTPCAVRDCVLRWIDPDSGPAETLRREAENENKRLEHPISDNPQVDNIPNLHDGSLQVAPLGCLILASAPDGTPIGMASCHLYGTNAEVAHAYTVPWMRKQGLLKELMVWITRWALERGATSLVFLTTPRVDMHIHSIASKEGFSNGAPHRDLSALPENVDCVYRRPLRPTMVLWNQSVVPIDSTTAQLSSPCMPKAPCQFSDVILRWEDTESEVSTALRRGQIWDFKRIDPAVGSFWPEDDAVPVYDKDLFSPPNGCFLVAVSPEGVPLACAGASMFGSDAELGRGFCIPSMRRTGLLSELGVWRMRWALERGAKRTVFWTRDRMTAVNNNAIKLGYKLTPPYRDLGPVACLAQRYWVRPLRSDTIPQPKLDAPIDNTPGEQMAASTVHDLGSQTVAVEA